MNIWCCSLALLAASASASAPYIPADAAQVLEVLPTRSMPDAERQALRLAHAAWRAEPTRPSAVDALARLYLERGRRTADPRYLGYASALLAPWNLRADVPPGIRLLRATVAQRDHRFGPALAELELALEQDPDLSEAWLMRAAIHQVQADYAAARASCARLADARQLLLGLACAAQIDGLTGRAAEAYARLGRLLELGRTGLTPELEDWIRLGRLDIGRRLGRDREVEAEFQALLARPRPSSEIKAAYADWLLDRHRYADVLELLPDRDGEDSRDDGLLLRRALARSGAGHPGAAADVALLRDRYRAARLRGDTAHLREEALFTLALLRRPAPALALAQANWQVQREPVDARLLLAAAIAARQPRAARPVQDWMRTASVEDVALRALLPGLERARPGDGA